MAALRLHKLLAWGGAGVLIGIVGLGPLDQAPPAAAQEKGYGQTISSPQQERELDYGTGTNRGGSALDSTNPWELMNKLRKSTAMDDATPPGDAIDQALKLLNSPPPPLQKTVQVPLKAP